MMQYRTDEGLPPLAPPDASDTERNRTIVARMVARHGAPSLDEYRRVYAACALDWPDDDGVRRRHPVAAPAAVMGHSMIVLGELDAANARQVDRLLTEMIRTLIQSIRSGSWLRMVGPHERNVCRMCRCRGT